MPLSSTSSTASRPWNNVEQLLQNLLERHIVPGCALSVRYKGEEIYTFAGGEAEQRPNQRNVTIDTIWDLASITKVLCTSHLYLKWINDELFSVESTLAEALDGVAKDITLGDCLSHSSGYENWRPLYSKYIHEQETWGQESIRQDLYQRAYTTAPIAPRQTIYKYSDLGFLALGAYAERRFGKPIHVLWEEFLPTMAKTGLYWGHPHAAATEDCPVRRRVVVGEVHDLHAAVLGGKAPHAGLFGSVSALTNVAHWSVNAYHGRSNDIEAETIRHFWAYRGAGSHCLGWDTPSPQGSSASSLWPKNGVGHLGFTGTSLWIAPDQELIVGFASNRVHPIVEGGALPGVPASPRFKAFQQFRPQLHQAILETLEYT